jgi:hypothetical protein
MTWRGGAATQANQPRLLTADDTDGADKTIREICVIRGLWIEEDCRSVK